MKSLSSIAPLLGTAMMLSLAAGACSTSDPIDQTASGPAVDGPLMPDWDASRSERLAFSGERFRTPKGFRVEEVAGDELIGSAVNLAFTLGRTADRGARGTRHLSFSTTTTETVAMIE